MLNAGTAHIVGVEDVQSASDLAPDLSADLDLGKPSLAVVAQKGKIRLWQPEGESIELKLDLERKDYITWGLAASPNKVNLLHTYLPTESA